MSTSHDTGDHCYRIDRMTPLGNPYVMERKEDRELVIKQYEDNFDHLYKNRKGFASYFDRILEDAKERDITLLCWCHPANCHARVIKKKLEELL